MEKIKQIKNEIADFIIMLTMIVLGLFSIFKENIEIIKESLNNDNVK